MRSALDDLPSDDCAAAIGRRLPVAQAIVGSSRPAVAALLQRVQPKSHVFTNLTVSDAKSTTGNAINEAGEVVGNAVTTARSSQEFAYVNGVGKLIGLAPGAYNQASGLLALNNTGQSVGYISNASGATHAMLYAGSALLDLNAVSDAPVPLTIAVGVSDSGEIAALAVDGTSYLLVPGGVYPPNSCTTR